MSQNATTPNKSRAAQLATNFTAYIEQPLGVVDLAIRNEVSPAALEQALRSIAATASLMADSTRALVREESKAGAGVGYAAEAQAAWNQLRRQG